MNLRLHPKASAEAREAGEYLDAAEPGLGSEFVVRVDRCLRLIREQPFAFTLIDGRVRHVVLAQFKYSILYTVREDEIVVLAIAHHRRNPGYWKNRLD